MKVYSEGEIKRINKELEKEFIEKGEFIKVIMDMRVEFSQELGYIRDLFLESINEILARQRKLEERIEGLEKGIEEEGPVIEFRELPEEEASRIVKEYINKNPGCTTSEIIEELRLEPPLVVEILRKFEEQGEVKGREPK